MMSINSAQVSPQGSAELSSGLERRLVEAIDASQEQLVHLHARRLALHAGGGVEGANAVEKMATRIIPALNDLEREWAVFKRHPAIPPAQTLINPIPHPRGREHLLHA